MASLFWGGGGGVIGAGEGRVLWGGAEAFSSCDVVPCQREVQVGRGWGGVEVVGGLMPGASSYGVMGGLVMA